MKNSPFITTIVLLFSLYANSQGYSNYYLKANINSNVNANINHNVSGIIYENKTITNIDYGALALANSQNEKNNIELQKISDEKQKNIAFEIAENPIKSYDYGYQNTFNVEKKDAKEFGFKSLTMSYVVPNDILFNRTATGTLQNISKEGIVTEIIFTPPIYNKEKKLIDLEKEYSYDDVIIGKESEVIDENNEKRIIFWHKKDLNRSTVFGVKGYKGTLIWEDKYEYGITDNYVSYNSNVGNGYRNFVKVRIYSDKDNVTFEQLEGRRYYFARLIEKIISTAIIVNEKY